MHVKEICYETTEKVKPLCHCAWEKTGIHGGHKLRRSPLSLSAQLGEYGRRSATTTPRRITEIPELSSKYDTNVSGLIMNSFASFGCFCASTYLETFGQVLKVHTNTPVLHWAVYTAKSLSFCKQVRTAGLGELSSLSHNMRNGEKKTHAPGQHLGPLNAECPDANWVSMHSSTSGRKLETASNQERAENQITFGISI